MGEALRLRVEYDSNKDKINVLEALSLAGDMTIQGQLRECDAYKGRQDRNTFI